MADSSNPFANMTDEQLDALIAQGQAGAGNGVPLSQIVMPENSVSSEMKGLEKAGGVGLIKGATDVVGLPGDVQQLAAGAFGNHGPQDTPSTYQDVLKALGNVGGVTFPSSQDIQNTVQKFTGPFYQPQTGVEKVAEGAGESVPFGLIGGGPGIVSKGLNMARAGLAGGASEVAGQATEGTNLETPARMAAALLTYPATGSLYRTPINPTSVRSAQAATLENAGVPVSASSINNNRLMATLEGGPPANQNSALDSAMKTVGGVPPSNSIDDFDQQIAARQSALQGQVRGLEQNTMLNVAPDLRKNLRGEVFNQTGVRARSPEENQQVVDAIKEFNARTPNNTLPGAQYNDLRERWGSSGIPALRAMATHLDNAMDASTQNTPYAGQWADWRKQWAGTKGLSAAEQQGGGAGNTVPLQPGPVTKGMYDTSHPLYRLAKAAEGIIGKDPLPYDVNPHAWAGLGMLGSGLATGYSGGAEHGIYGGMMGAAVPEALSLLKGPIQAGFRSRGGQNMLRNLDPNTVSALLAKQGVSGNNSAGEPQ